MPESTCFSRRLLTLKITENLKILGHTPENENKLLRYTITTKLTGAPVLCSRQRISHIPVNNKKTQCISQITFNIQIKTQEINQSGRPGVFLARLELTTLLISLR